MEVLYEDNHIIIVSKRAGEIVQGDKTGDVPLSEIVGAYLKEKYSKPGNVFVGVPHRLDRPVSGLVVLAKTSKALARLNEMFRVGSVDKRYLAIVKNKPKEPEGRLENWLVRNEKQNRSYAYDKEVPNSKQAVLNYRLVASSVNYHLLEVELLTDVIIRYGVSWPRWGVLSRVTSSMVPSVPILTAAYRSMHSTLRLNIPYHMR